MTSRRKYPELPMVGVGGVVIRDGRALLIRRGSEPLKGQWSIPGGLLELGETIVEGVERELHEETGLAVRVLDLIEVFDRIFSSEGPQEDAAAVLPAGVGTEMQPGGVRQHAETSENRQTSEAGPEGRQPLYHFVILDYLCEAGPGEPRAGGDVTDVAFAAEQEMGKFGLTTAATRVLKKAFAMARESGRG